MARISIEECWWSDPRRSMLGELVGGLHTADGIMLMTWRLAQQHWGSERSMVPVHVFHSIKYSKQIIESALAEVRGDYVYVRGSSAYLDWVYEQKQTAKDSGRKGGLISAKRPRDKNGRLLPSDHQANTKGSPSAGPARSKQGENSADSTSLNRSNDEKADNSYISDKVELGNSCGKTQATTKQTPSELQANPSKPKLSGSGSGSNYEDRKNEKPGDPGEEARPSSPSVSDAIYRLEEISQVKSLISQMFEGKAPSHRLRASAKVLSYFGTPKAFEEWANTLLGNERCPDPVEDLQGFDRYFGKALSQTLQGIA